MAQDWIGLMKKVPWKTVAEAAPAIADAARRLGKRIDAVREGAEAQAAAEAPAQAAAAPASAPTPPTPAAPPLMDEEQRQALVEAKAAVAALQARVDGLEGRQAQLAAELEQAARLVGELGEQNGRLAQAQEALARRLGQAVTVAWAGVLIGVVAAGVAVAALLR